MGDLDRACGDVDEGCFGVFGGEEGLGNFEGAFYVDLVPEISQWVVRGLRSLGESRRCITHTSKALHQSSPSASVMTSGDSPCTSICEGVR